nr:hypothetical protein [Nonomuraea harbinensis]
MQLRAVLVGEDPARVLPRLTPLQALGVLSRPMLLQHRHRARIQGRHAVGGLGLGVALLEVPSDLYELLLHSEGALRDVEELPLGSACLTSAQAPERDQVEEGVQPVLVGMIEKFPELDWRPHHNWWWP